jgi:DNA-binding MarR family transcriptional regulator
MSTNTKEANAHLAAELRPSILRLSRHLRRDANQSGSSSVDMQILKALEQNDGITVAELAAAEQISRPSMSEHIKRLVLRGYVKRARSNQELAGGPITLRITRAGKTYLRAAGRRRSDWLISRLNKLSERERAALDRATKSLQMILDAANTTA